MLPAPEMKQCSWQFLSGDTGSYVCLIKYTICSLVSVLDAFMCFLVMPLKVKKVYFADGNSWTVLGLRSLPSHRWMFETVL